MLKSLPEPRYLAVGRVLRPHGVRGELRVEILTDYPERIANLGTLYVGEHHHPYTVAGVRFHQDMMLLTLEGCADRNTADTLRGALVEIALEDAVPLEDKEYYHFQVIGMQVLSVDGEALGEVVDIFDAPGANDVLVVHGTRGEILLPVTEEVILDLDMEAGTILVHLLPGLLDAD